METRQPLLVPVVRAMDAAERLLGEPIGVDDLARAAGLSRFHFHRVFQEAVGEPPAQYVERLRLERAALLLLAAEIPITELAWEVGFRNPETFARRFRARFDVTARDYRRHQIDLWNRLGLEAGRDPGGAGGAIQVRDLPALDIVFQRTLGDDKGFTFDHAIDPWRRLGDGHAMLVGRTLDWPGITPAERVRTDHGMAVERPPEDSAMAIGHLARGAHATIEVQGPGPIPNQVYQRLFVWSVAGSHRLAPGPIVELFHEDTVLVCQPVREHIGGAEWFPSSESKSTAR